MSDADDVQDALVDNAKGPKSATGDNGSMTQHSIQDQIAADRYLRGKDAVSGRKGFSLTRIVPPGAS